MSRSSMLEKMADLALDFGGARSGGSRFLVLAPDDSIAAVVEGAVALAGGEFVRATTALDCIAKLVTDRVDGVILDWGDDTSLPILAWLNDHAEFETLPRVVITKSDELALFDAYQNGADVVLQHPMMPEELGHFLRQFLGSFTH
ncbi:MAG: hypothetical protein ABL949_01080 [Fimbriimonadaceae bacterium]